MILTAAAIHAAMNTGDIVIDPFDPARLSPNAYDWRLGQQLRACDSTLDAAAASRFTEHGIPATGMVLRPQVLYLGVTCERTCSGRYAQLLNGSRDVGALGIWVDVREAGLPPGLRRARQLPAAQREICRDRRDRPVPAARGANRTGRLTVTSAITPVVTGLDLPAGSPGGSVELLRDLYTGSQPPLAGQVFMLAADDATPNRAGVTLLTVPGKCTDGPGFWRYLADLTSALSAAIAPAEGAVAHLQHLTYGASPALIMAYPRLRRIALVHGTDLLAAQAGNTQMHILNHVASAASAIVVPTTAMATMLRRLAPHVPAQRLTHIPWGIPDQLLTSPPARTRMPDGELRLLYAGRLSAEKGADSLFRACDTAHGIRLSVTASHQHDAAAPRGTLPVRWLGWLPRQRLWQAFADHDLLVVPSVTLEAFCLLAVEAQACGLPVLYQPVPGLTEILAGSAATTDFTKPGRLAADLRWLRTDPGALAHLTAAGLANAARYPLSRTAAQLADLTRQVT